MNKADSGLLLSLLVLGLILSACQPIERSARDAFVLAKGFLDQAQDNHEADCKAGCDRAIVPTIKDPAKCRALCATINRAIDAQNLLGHEINIYCASAAYLAGTGKCEPHGDLRIKLGEALANLNSIMDETSGLTGIPWRRR